MSVSKYVLLTLIAKIRECPYKTLTGKSILGGGLTFERNYLGYKYKVETI